MTHPAFTDEVVRVRDTVDDWGEKTTDLEKSYPCRVVSTSRTFINDNGKTLQLSFKVTLPGDADILTTDKVKINDVDYTIVRLEPVATYGTTRYKVVYV